MQRKLDEDMTLSVFVLLSIFGWGVAIPPNYYPMEKLDPMAEGAVCKGGYYSDLGGQDTCCSYHQCDSVAIMFGFPFGKAYRRWCWEPLMWNPETYTCDRKENNPIDECRELADTTGCWGLPNDHKERPDCVVENNTQCCQVGDREGAESGKGFLFTNIDENGDASSAPGARYKFCEDRKSQLCPVGTLFDLDTCCCTNLTCDCTMLYWNFVDPQPWQAKQDEAPGTTDLCGAVFRTKTCSLTDFEFDRNYVYCNEGNVMKTDFFVNVFIDSDFIIGGIFMRRGPGDAVLFSNVDPEIITNTEGVCEVSATVIGSTLEFVICDQSGSISGIPAGAPDSDEFTVLMFSKDKETIVVAVEGIGEMEVPYSPIRGTICPLSVGGFTDLEGGMIFDFIIVPSLSEFNMAFTMGEVQGGPLTTFVKNF